MQYDNLKTAVLLLSPSKLQSRSIDSAPVSSYYNKDFYKEFSTYFKRIDVELWEVKK